MKLEDQKEFTIFKRLVESAEEKGGLISVEWSEEDKKKLKIDCNGQEEITDELKMVS